MNKLILFLLISLGCQINLPAQAQYEITKIGMLGCHVQDRIAPSIPYFADSLQPKYCIWLGDNVYADTETDSNHIQRQYDKLAAKPGFQKLWSQSKFYCTWDDHDYGLNNADKNYRYKEASKRMFRAFWKLEQEIPEQQDGIYYADIETQNNGKKIQFIMLDGRYNLDKSRGHKDALGEKQWVWLEEQLKKEADVRFIVLGYQILLNRPTFWEALVKLGDSRKRLFEIIERTQANKVIFLTGDQHTAEVLRSMSPVRYKTYEIMACGINQTETPGVALNRVAGPDKTLHDSPMIEIHWTEKPFIRVLNRNAETSAITMFYEFRLDDIYWKK